jgi:hypothetical protein
VSDWRDEAGEAHHDPREDQQAHPVADPPLGDLPLTVILSR